MIDLSIIIISYNTRKLTLECIKSIMKNTKNIIYEILVIDNDSTDGSVESLRNFSHQNSRFGLKIIENKTNLGFGGANNQGMKIAKGKYILLINSDTLVKNNVLCEMILWMNQNPGIGIASCSLKNADNSIQGTGGYFPNLIRVFSWMTIQDLPFIDYFIKPFHPLHQKLLRMGQDFYKTERELDWVTGAFFLMRRKVFENVGFFDKDYFMYTEETDYCFRAKEFGWRIYYNPKWSIIHYGGASGKSWSYVIPEFKGVKTFYKKHYPPWEYPILRILLKTGALGRMILYGILFRREAAKVYAEAFKII